MSALKIFVCVLCAFFKSVAKNLILGKKIFEKHLLQLETTDLSQVTTMVRVNHSHYRSEVLRGFQKVKVPRLRDNGQEWR